MKEVLTILIGQEGATIIHPDNGSQSEAIAMAAEMADGLSSFCAQHALSATKAMLYIAEDLLFYKETTLPLKTRNPAKAIAFQVEVLTPYKEDEVLYAYTSRRRKEHHRILLAAAGRKKIEPFAAAVSNAGFTLMGLFPESQRYVNRSHQKKSWALVTPGRFYKIFKFNGSHLEGKFFYGTDPDFDDLAKLCDSETIYHLQPPAGSPFLTAAPLLAQRPVLKEFNLLPARFHRPDYFRMAIIALVALNLITFAGTFIAKQVSLARSNRLVDTRIEELAPRYLEIKELQNEEKNLTAEIENVKMTGSNPDIIEIIAELSDRLPKSSYLDMMRLNGNNTLQIQGFTNDINELTATLQDLGRAQLKSTRRMRNKTYFQIEITLT